MNVGLSAGAVVCCGRLGQATVLTHSSRKSCRSRRILCLLPWQRQPTNEVGDGYTLSVVQKRRRSKSREFQDALATLTEEQYDVWDLGVDIWWVLRVERMNRDGTPPVAWTEAQLTRRGYGDGDSSQHELQCTARVLEVALPYDELNN